MIDKKLNIMVVGSFPPPYGGTTVLLDYLVRELREIKGVECSIINVSGYQFRSQIFVGLRRTFLLITGLIRGGRRADVITLHVATTSLYVTGPIALIFSRIFGKAFIIRKFAGTDYNDLKWPKRNIIRYIVRKADLFLVETRYLVDRARLDGCQNVEWFPNHRPIKDISQISKTSEHPCSRFVYLAHVRPDKGILELIEAAERLDEVQVDVYGSFMDGLAKDIFLNKKNIFYRGVVRPDEVHSVLQQYDAMVFPTYHDGEGHPGVILEAYIAGLPVITTKWKSVPEIVDDGVGILIEPKNVEQLTDAMRRLSRDIGFYECLKSNTYEKATFYSSRHWADQFVKYCLQIMEE